MTGLLPLLQEFYREKLAMLLRHQAGARLTASTTSTTPINTSSTARTCSFRGWRARSPSSAARPLTFPRWTAARREGCSRRILQEDEADAQAFVDRWAPRIRQMTNARHAKMLRVILGETLEQKRFFEQALAGQTDLLGRRPDHVGPRVGEVLPTRWIE